MATKEELFISFSPNTYRESKSNILKSQADILHSLKRLHNLTILARQKHDLKKQLNKLLSSTISKISSIQDKMPTPKVPKTIQQNESVKTKKDSTEQENIEEELETIQEKLRKLNN